MLKSNKRRTVAAPQDPVWCHRCSIRIAPYDNRAVHNGKIYHRGCYTKLNQAKAQPRKN